MKVCLSAVMAFALLLTSGCSLIPKPEPVQTWQLEAATVVSDQQEATLTGIRLLRPLAQDLINGRFILVVPEGEPVSVYADARWSAPIPNLWRDYLLDAMQRDSRFAQVSADEVRVAAQYELISRMESFQTEYQPEGAEVVVRRYLQLVQADTRAILAVRAINSREPVRGESLSEVVAAFSRLMSKQSEDIRSWLLTAVPTAQSAQTN